MRRSNWSGNGNLLGAAAVAIMGLCTPAGAEDAKDYPSRPVQLVIGYGAGTPVGPMQRRMWTRANIQSRKSPNPSCQNNVRYQT